MREGLVQIRFWSSTKSVMCPRKPVRMESSEATYRLFGTRACDLGFDSIVFADGELTVFASDWFCPRPCAAEARTAPLVTTAHTHFLEMFNTALQGYGCMYAMVRAI